MIWGGGPWAENSCWVFFPGQLAVEFFFLANQHLSFFSCPTGSWVFFFYGFFFLPGCWVEFFFLPGCWVVFPGRVAVEFFFRFCPSPPPPKSLMVLPLVQFANLKRRLKVKSCKLTTYQVFFLNEQFWPFCFRHWTLYSPLDCHHPLYLLGGVKKLFHDLDELGTYNCPNPP